MSCLTTCVLVDPEAQPQRQEPQKQEPADDQTAPGTVQPQQAHTAPAQVSPQDSPQTQTGACVVPTAALNRPPLGDNNSSDQQLPQQPVDDHPPPQPDHPGDQQDHTPDHAGGHQAGAGSHSHSSSSGGGGAPPPQDGQPQPLAAPDPGAGLQSLAAAATAGGNGKDLSPAHSKSTHSELSPEPPARLLDPSSCYASPLRCPTTPSAVSLHYASDLAASQPDPGHSRRDGQQAGEPSALQPRLDGGAPVTSPSPQHPHLNGHAAARQVH